MVHLYNQQCIRTPSYEDENPTSCCSALSMATFRAEKLRTLDQAYFPKLHKTADASIVSQTSHYDNGNCHYRHPSYHMKFYVYFNQRVIIITLLFDYLIDERFL